LNKFRKINKLYDICATFFTNLKKVDYNMSCSTNCFSLQQKILDFNNNKVKFDSCSIGQSTIEQNILNNDMSKQVKIMQAEVDDLQNKLDNLNSLTNGNKTMKNDFVNQYNFQYLQNTCIFIGIIIIFICFFTLFKTDTVASAANPVSAATNNIGNGVSTAIN